MVMLDTNIILRYLLDDNEEMASAAEQVIQKGNVQVSMEIMAEVVYVLKGVYSIERKKIKEKLLDFLDEVNAVDFPDCILYAYNRVKGYEIKTFDKKLNKLLRQDR